MNARDASAEDLAPEMPACEWRCVAGASHDPAHRDGSFLVDDDSLDAQAASAAAGIILPARGGGRAAALLEAGARCVLLGEAALRDPSIIAPLADRFGAGRVGVYAPSRRLPVRWSFDDVSNADFKVLTPSLGAPAWEVLLADGTGTGTQALWWIGAMLDQGASLALLRVDIRDDADLNLCADCMERFGERVWIGPLEDEAPAIADWIAFGHARRIALGPELMERHATLRAATGPGRGRGAA
jgi:hypothetical protein